MYSLSPWVRILLLQLPSNLWPWFSFPSARIIIIVYFKLKGCLVYVNLSYFSSMAYFTDIVSCQEWLHWEVILWLILTLVGGHLAFPIFFLYSKLHCSEHYWHRYLNIFGTLIKILRHAIIGTQGINTLQTTVTCLCFVKRLFQLTFIPTSII